MSKTQTLLRILSFPFFSTLFGVFPVAFLWAKNQLQVTPRVVLPVFLVTLAAVVFVWLLCSLLARSWQKGAIVSSILFLFFYLYGHLYAILKGKSVFGVEIGYIKFTLAYLVIFLVGSFLLVKFVRNSKALTLYLNLIAALLVLFNLGVVVKSNSAYVKAPQFLEPEVGESTDDNSGQPDIYYIILDAYSRADFLLDAYQFDNSAFITWLEDRGFYVANCANSNYDGTLSSISSSLNYAYMDELHQSDDGLLDENAEISSQLGNNRIREELRAFGYQFVTARGYSAFNDIRDADIYINFVEDARQQDSLQRTQFTRLYFSTTVLRLIFEIYTANPSEHPRIPHWFELNPDFEYMDTSSFWYNQTRYVFDYLEGIPAMEGNYLVYAHINAPHGPFVFDQQGNFRYVPPSSEDPQYYIDTIVYLNQRIQEMVEILLAESTTPPIIVIQADHGSHIVKSGFDKHKILSAYYLPGSDFPLYDTITPVNTFRVILNEYFSKKIELLPDQIYVKVLNERELHPSQCDYPAAD